MGRHLIYNGYFCREPFGVPTARLSAASALVCWLLLLATSHAELVVKRVADLNPGYSGSYPANLKVYAGALFFSATTIGAGRELWKYDGQQITLVSNINDSVSTNELGDLIGADSSPAEFAEFNGLLFFSAFDQCRGAELWRTDGTNCLRAADINPDPDDSFKTTPASSWPKEITVAGNRIFFPANNGTAKENYELWQFNGTAASPATNIHPNSGSSFSSYPSGLKEFNGSVFFSADDGSNGYELWKHDGTRAIIYNLNPGGSSSHSYPKHFTAFGNALYFQAQHASYGTELWKTDGSTVSLVTNLAPGTASSFPENLAVFDGALYFRATGPSGRSSLWKFDGTSVSLAAEINPFGDAFPKNLVVFEDRLFFTANDGLHGWELWACDGSNAWLVFDLNPAGDAFPEELTVFGNSLYFVATTPETGHELWRCDGQNINLVADINPGSAPAYPKNLTVFGNRLCFAATEDGLSNWELWSVLENLKPPVLKANWQGAVCSVLVSGEPLRTYTIEASSDLSLWTAIWTNTCAVSGSALFLDGAAGSTARRFYRAR